MNHTAYLNLLLRAYAAESRMWFFLLVSGVLYHSDLRGTVALVPLLAACFQLVVTAAIRWRMRHLPKPTS